MKKTQFVILFCLLTALIFAQDPFVVYSTKGKVTILERNKNFTAKPGKAISSNSSIEIYEDAGITFICKEGRLYSLTQPGFHSLNKTKDSCYKTSSSVLTNFFKYLWDQAIKQTSDAGKNRKAYLDNAGVVIRDFADIWVSRAFDTLNYSGVGGAFPIYWKSYIDAKEYAFSIYADGNTEVPFYRTMVKGMKIPVVDLAPQIKPGNTYYWSVSIKGENEDPLYVLNYVTSEAYGTALANINKQKPTVEGQAEEAFRTAFMLENAHYLAEAYQYYVRAAGLYPENVLYRSALISFRKDYEIK